MPEGGAETHDNDTGKPNNIVMYNMSIRLKPKKEDVIYDSKEPTTLVGFKDKRRGQKIINKELAHIAGRICGVVSENTFTVVAFGILLRF